MTGLWAVVPVKELDAAKQRLAPHLAAMRARLAAAIGAQPDQLNAKASSPEGVGALGRGEGIAAAAVVLLSAD